MARLSLAFYTLAALCGLGGMIWGSAMGASGDHSAFTAHAHLNLLGWVGLAVMGTFHHLTGRAGGVVGWANFALSSFGAIGVPTAMYFLMVHGDTRFVPLIIAGGMASIAGMVVFLLAVLLAWRSPRVSA